MQIDQKDKLNAGIEHWDLTPKSAEDREVLLALSLCRKLFENSDLQADVASVLFFSMLNDARPLARAKLKNDQAAAMQAEHTLIKKWMPRVTGALAKKRIGD